ncbi:hypothetical protein BJV78DRAFT_1156608 [Lactifluus subvellereus]|nr:hypothetical protein BJV78DRAFT_1156608 [Lactifluus subvellereus]
MQLRTSSKIVIKYIVCPVVRATVRVVLVLMPAELERCPDHRRARVVARATRPEGLVWDRVGAGVQGAAREEVFREGTATLSPAAPRTTTDHDDPDEFEEHVESDRQFWLLGGVIRADAGSSPFRDDNSWLRTCMFMDSCVVWVAFLSDSCGHGSSLIHVADMRHRELGRHPKVAVKTAATRGQVTDHKCVWSDTPGGETEGETETHGNRWKEIWRDETETWWGVGERDVQESRSTLPEERWEERRVTRVGETEDKKMGGETRMGE